MVGQASCGSELREKPKTSALVASTHTTRARNEVGLIPPRSGAKNPFRPMERPPIDNKIVATALVTAYQRGNTRQAARATTNVSPAANQKTFTVMKPSNW